jgi:hypothetical protein
MNASTANSLTALSRLEPDARTAGLAAARRLNLDDFAMAISFEAQI